MPTRTRALLLLLFALALPAAPLAAQGGGQLPGLAGTYLLVDEGSDEVNRAIDRAVARMNPVTRAVARGRLRRTNSPYRRIVLARGEGRVSIVTDARAPIVTAETGEPVRWRREDGELMDVSTRWRGDALEQTFAAGDGKRVNLYTPSPDGATLTLRVTVTSPRLPQPLTYDLRYRRAE